MPRIVVELDGDKILGELIKFPDYNPEARLFASGAQGIGATAVKGVAQDLFNRTFETATGIMVPELGYGEDEFVLKTGFAGEFDQNPIPFNIDIVANDRLAWYDNERAMRSNKPEVRNAKKNRISIAIADVMQAYIKENFGVDWKVNCWPLLGQGVYYQTS